MKPEESKLLNDSLSKLFKVDSETLASLYNEAGDLVDFSPILTADANKVAKYKSDNDSQYKRGIKEGASKIENAIREKYDIESELTGVELVELLLSKKVDEVKTSSTKDITKHPDYIKLQLEHEKKLKEVEKDLTKKLEAQQVEFNRAKLFEKVREKALQNLNSRNPILPTDPVKASNWRETYLNDLKQGNYQEASDGTINVLDKEGALLKNIHGHAITFDEYEKEIADKYFEYPVAEDRGSAGNKPPVKPPLPGQLPKNEEERLTMLRDPKITPQRRKELTELVIK